MFEYIIVRERDQALLKLAFPARQRKSIEEGRPELSTGIKDS